MTNKHSPATPHSSPARRQASATRSRCNSPPKAPTSSCTGAMPNAAPRPSATSKTLAARHVSSPPTYPTPTTYAASPTRRATSTSWSTTRASTGSPRPFETTDADFDDQINTNLRAPYVLVQKLVPGMIERGHGSVINVTTVAASTPAAGAGIYGASKAALELLTKLWADEFGARACGSTPPPPDRPQTPGTADLSTELIEALGRTTALGRTADADEIANAVTFVASPAASYVNGAILTIGGGAQAIKPGRLTLPMRFGALRRGSHGSARRNRCC